MRSPGGGSSFAIDEPMTNRKKVPKISCQAKVRVYKLHLEVYGHSREYEGSRFRGWQKSNRETIKF